jgi:hypothetical protein
VTGSQDAYNMYYVDETFLAQNATDAVLRTEALCLTNKSTSDAPANADVVVDVTKQRETKYARLSE